MYALAHFVNDRFSKIDPHPFKSLEHAQQAIMDYSLKEGETIIILNAIAAAKPRVIIGYSYFQSPVETEKVDHETQPS